jgi:hypothetical protein
MAVLTAGVVTLPAASKSALLTGVAMVAAKLGGQPVA